MDKTMQQLKVASPYSGVLTREQFLFYETRTTAKLLDEGLSPTEIQEKNRAGKSLSVPHREIGAADGTHLHPARAGAGRC